MNSFSIAVPAVTDNAVIQSECACIEPCMSYGSCGGGVWPVGVGVVGALFKYIFQTAGKVFLKVLYIAIRTLVNNKNNG